MGKTYTGVGSLTGRRIKFQFDRPGSIRTNDSNTHKDGLIAMIDIMDVHAREVLDSRGNPTVEAEVTLEAASPGEPSSPPELRLESTRAVETARRRRRTLPGQRRSQRCQQCERLNFGALGGMDASDQRAVDAKLIDSTALPKRDVLGANAILAFSMATARAAANEYGLPLSLSLSLAAPGANILPTPMMNILNGGAHADNNGRLPGIHGEASRGAKRSLTHCAGASEVFHTLSRF